MNKQFGLLYSLLLGLFLSLGPVNDAEAKRFGGGASFGSRSSYGSTFKRQASVAPAAPSFSQQQAMTRNQSVRDGLSRRGGLMGMLGGLAIGGLLGSLLFGGAFEHINFMDLLIFAGVAYLLYRLLAARQRATTPQPIYRRGAEPTSIRAGQDQAPPAVAAAPETAPAQDSRDWFRGGLKNDAVADHIDYNQPRVPVGFDQAGFLVGAKHAYHDLQKAWDARDLAAVRRLTTDGMYLEIETRIKEIGADNRTTVLKLEAELLEAREAADQLEAVVLFDGILREADDDQARQVREVWHFTKPRDAEQPTWFLDGIQQLED
jgi:predicted lipid-binding transport protein (Tim44 family)